MHKYFAQLKDFNFMKFYSFGAQNDLSCLANTIGEGYAPYCENGNCEFSFSDSKNINGSGSLPAMYAERQRGDGDCMLVFKENFLFFDIEPSWEQD